MSIPFKKLVFSLCAILLLGQNANAGWLDEVQKVIDQQNNNTPNQQGEQVQQSQLQNQQQVEQAQESTPKFNSLAEEAAYKKQKEEREEKQRLEAEQNTNNTVNAKIHELKTMKDQFYKNYFIKDTDTPEMIDVKYKNRDQLFQNMMKDLQAYNDKVAEYDKMKRYGDVNIYTLNDETNQIENTVKDDSGNIYLKVNLLYFYGMQTYESYLQNAYQGYNDRQKEKEQEIKRVQANAQAQKDAQAQQTLWLKESKKAQKICNAWVAKAHKQAYSLGTGDSVLHNGLRYTIQQQNANTFLAYNIIMGQAYLKKSECLPYPMPAAPSQYCQQAR